MYCKVHKPDSTPGVHNNREGCDKLANYLSKEDKMQVIYPKPFFSHSLNAVTKETVINQINNNVRTLKKKQDKFYMLTINPSQKELQHLIYKVTGKKINSFEELSFLERENVIQELRSYTRDCMDQYALNFKRPTINTGADLVYFAKIEEQRKFVNTDNEVVSGKAKEGDLKLGLQLHVHVIVSRMDATQKVALSPLTKSRGDWVVVNGIKTWRGFDRVGWSDRCAIKFSEKYNYFQLRNGYERNYISNKTKGFIKSNIKRTATNEVLDKEFCEVKNTVRNAKWIYRFSKHPKKALANLLRQQVIGIIQQKSI